MPRSRTLAALAATAAALAGAAGIAGADPLGDQFQISQQGPDGDYTYDTWGPSVAFNSVRNEHLVVWVGDTSTGPEIFAQRITQTGARIDAPVQLSTDGIESDDPVSVAYDPKLDRYLVSWETNDEIRLRRVGGDGTALGTADKVVSDVAYSDIETTQVVYDSIRQRFLLVWKATTTQQHAFAQVVAPDGDPTGPDKQVTMLAGGIDDAIDVAFNATDGVFAVAFHSDDNPPGREEAFIQRIDADAGRIGAEIQVSDGGPLGYQAPPRVAWNSKRNEWLVAWSGESPNYGTDNEYEIRIQRLSATGAEIGTDDARVTSLGPDGSTAYRAFRPDIAYHPEVDEYLLVFHGDDNTPPLIVGADEVFGQRLSGTGEEIGSDDFRISTTLPDDSTSPRALRPRVAYDADVCDYMVVWYTRNSSSTTPPSESEVHGRRVDGPICAPRPTAPPAISGTAREGDALACTPGSYRFADTTTLQWLRDGQPIPGATGSSYVPTAEDVGRDISCRSTGTNPTGSASQTTGAVKIAAKPDPAVDRVAVEKLKRKVSKRDRKLPFRYVTKGKIVLPEGVRTADGCAGKVSVQIKRGRKTVSNRRAKVKPDCTFRSKVKFTLRNRLGDRGKLKFTVRFLGNGHLLPKKAKPLKRRFG